ncbi:MAG: bacteriocin family protein [Firmicutes bacterium]|nr:bacteriocin family protein [Bacillota bacterium]
MEYLDRQSAPISADIWEKVDQVTVGAARKILTGRKFVDILGPFGPGVQTVNVDVYAGSDYAQTGILAEESTHPVRPEGRKLLTLPIIYKDFHLYWRDLESSKKFGMPVDVSVAAAAASFVAFKEDELVFQGGNIEGMAYEGLLNAQGRNVLPLGDWTNVGSAFNDALKAVETLVEKGYYTPLALVVHPRNFTKMHRVYESGVLEIEHVKELFEAGVYRTPAVPENKALVVATGPQNFDLVIAQDLTTAYLGPIEMNHQFRVLESLALRIKRPGAVVTLEA